MLTGTETISLTEVLDMVETGFIESRSEASFVERLIIDEILDRIRSIKESIDE